ncbi:hypothetical protein GCM10009745_59670 [Kribbella yunnanensis]|uniref:Insecticidal toxin complex protein n=1 Tax=Kribbella yunnanensis TaxID=190194 RepID=A0ABP4UEN9_9ACTN
MRRLRSADELGTSTTNASGGYRIEFTAPDRSFDLVVSTAVDGRPAAVVRQDAQQHERVDLMVFGDDRTEYERVLAAVEPALDGQRLSSLTDPADYEFLARATALDVAQVEALAVASRHAEATSLPADGFFALLRAGKPAELSALARRPQAEIAESLSAATESAVIPALAGDEFATELWTREVASVASGAGSLGELFSRGVPDDQERTAAVRAYLSRGGDLADFWAAAGDAPYVPRLRLTFEVGALSNGDSGVLDDVLTRFEAGEIAATKDLARIADDLPPEVRDRIAARYPGPYATHRLTSQPTEAADPAVEFLRANPEFDLVGTPVDGRSVPDEAARTELAGIQRTLKIAPRFEAMQELRAQGLSSAAAVAARSPEDFASAVAGAVAADEAADIHAQAVQVHATAVNLVADLRTAGQIDVPWLAPAEELTDRIPNWEEMFGSTSYCACSECRSFYSQAAYLADLLDFLWDTGVDMGGTSMGSEVIEPLYWRRPDLWDLKLSCDNTNLALPYVDLVNELLENAVSPQTAIPDTERQTSGDADQLRVRPQHVNQGAYDKLRAAVYPWDFPFDLWRQQVNTALGQLGIPRETLLRATSVPGAVTGPVVEETLNLSKVSAQIVAGEPLTPARTLPEFWGLPANHPIDYLIEALLPLPAMLQRSGLDYAELTAIVATRFVNLSISVNPDEPCNTSQMRMDGLTADSIDRLHRFARLQRALGWSPGDVDRAIFVLGGRLNRATLTQLAAVRQLQARFGLPLDRVLALVGRLDLFRYEDEVPLYDRLFLDPTVVVTQPGVPNPFELNEARTEVKVVGPLLQSTVTAALLAVLQITDDELQLMVNGPASVTPDRMTTVANLTSLFRTVTLARALELSVTEFLRVTELSGLALQTAALQAVTPAESELMGGDLMRFPVPPPPALPSGQEGELPAGALPRLPAPPVAAVAALPVDVVVDRIVRLADAVQELSVAGFGVGDVESVIAGAPAGLPDDAQLTSTLTALRSALRDVYQETTRTDDDQGDLTRKNLGLLGWGAAAVDDALATLRGTTTYRVSLATLPKPIPPTIPVRYDAVEQQLVATGPITDAVRQSLEALSTDATYRAAVLALWDAPRDAVAGRMKALRLPTYSTSLPTLPADFVLPKSLTGRVYYDVTTRALCSRGYLSAADADALQAASGDLTFPVVVAELRRLQSVTPVAEGNKFFTRPEAEAMFATDLGAAGRFRLAQAKLGPVIHGLLTDTTVKQHVGAATSLDAGVVEALLGTWLRSVPIGTFLDSAFVGSDPAVVVSRNGFPNQFAALTRLHRVALVLIRARITAPDLPLLFKYTATSGWLDLNALPASVVRGVSPLFAPLVRMLGVLRLRSAVPEIEPVIAQARATGTTVDKVMAELHKRTGWDQADITDLARVLGLDQPAEFADERNLLALAGAVRMIQRLGVSANRVATWLVAEPTPQAAEAAWQTAKAKYALKDWPAVGGPLQDKVREQQRKALLAYLVANPLEDRKGRRAWYDEIGIHNHFLLDVEMGPCQQTTRLAQAIYSVQLFIQRCHLNLEPNVRDIPEYYWKRWEWLKEYRLWEANQKIFLYPENYTEPELRATKSPFFVDLENELLQGEVTGAAVETAFLTYLEKLNQVARLQPCGMYSYYNEKRSEHTLYIFARTDSTPRQYYFRTLINGWRWTPWEHVELDVEGETLVPMVWNERLYVFWLSFVEVAVPETMTYPPADGKIHPAKTHWEIKLNWSQYVNGHWQAKKMSQQSLTTVVSGTWWVSAQGVPIYLLPPDDDAKLPELYICRPVIDPASGDLVLWVMLNKTYVYRWGDPELPVGTFGVAGGFQLSARRGTVSTASLVVTHESRMPPIAPWPTNTVVQNNEFVESADSDGQLHLPSQNYPGQMVRRLQRTPGATPFRVLYPHQYVDHAARFMMFFTDATRTYLIKPRLVDPNIPDPPGPNELTTRSTGTVETPPPLPVKQRPALAGRPVTGTSVVVPSSARAEAPRADLMIPLPTWYAEFVRFYHPHIELFLSRLANSGIDALLDPIVQANPESIYGSRFNFGTEPGSVYGADGGGVLKPYPDEPVAFELDDAYAEYNWELFFQIPLMVAERLSANQRFEEAQQWFHRIFDPTSRKGEGPQRYWRTKPFVQKTKPDYQKQRIEEILKRLADPRNSDDQHALREWIDNPFQPDVVARLRTTAYQKAVVMKYLDNLIAWGDQQFRRDTMESINQATQLYLLAAELLGPKPVEVDDRAEPAAKSFWEVREATPPGRDPVTLAEALVPVAGSVAPSIAPGVSTTYLKYFRLPRNEKLLGYWDTVADRLFKIRHCQNIDGVTRQVPLFGAPIDPSLLAQAAAAGIDLATILDDINAPLPHYRFGSMVAKAKELTAEVKSFGTALAAALDKRDAEVMARLRSTQEVAVLKAIRDVKQQGVDEAAASLEALMKSKNTVEAKHQYYQDKKLTNDKEDAHQRLTTETFEDLYAARGLNKTASVIALLPDLKIGFPTTIGATWGSTNVIAGLRGSSEALSTAAGITQSKAGLSATLGGYDHRFAEWQFQAAQAKLEAEQLEQQIQAGIIKLKIAQREVENQDLQIANAKATDELLHSKFTNKELYDWMAGQLSTSYFQAYQLAYDVAKRAERAYRHELGVDDSNFVKFGYWDSLHKGLLAGERLGVDLNRMDAAYLEANAREFELTKRISIAQLDPEALQSLKQTGRCFVSLPEALFDLDNPGHYLRRIKSLGVTVPCVAGPYTGVHLTATLLRSSVRVDPRAGNYPRKPSDPRFRDQAGAVQSIVTSAGQEDSGLFEVNLRDERYLPFEGAGAISEWELSLPGKFRQFDYESITDVVLNLRYTARQGGSGLAEDAVGQLTEALNKWVHAGGGQGLFRTFSVRREFADQWSRFVLPAGSADPSVTLRIGKDRFPYLFHGHKLDVVKPEAVLVLSREHLKAYATGTALTASLAAPGGPGSTTLSVGADGQPRGQFAFTVAVTDAGADWVLTIPRTAVAKLPASLRTADNLLRPEVVEDLLIVCNYKLTTTNG